MLQMNTDALASPALWSAVLQIVVVNLVLSGDNAVMIAMACRDLPRPQRVWGIVIGTGLAVLLRIVFAGAIAWLFQFPYLKFAGGVALIIIAAKLLVPEPPDRTQAEAISHLWRAIIIVLVADLVMSFDNILAVVEIAENNLTLVAIGLTLSIPFVLGGAALITGALERFPVLIWVGSGLLGWVGGESTIGDPAIWRPLRAAVGARAAEQIGWAAAAAGLVLAVLIGALWRRRSIGKNSSAQPGP